MALHRLSAEARSYRAFGVVGTEAHIGLLADDQQLAITSQPRVHHVRPPQEYDGTLSAHYVGYLDDLSASEVTLLQDWIRAHRDTAERMSASAISDYVLIPHREDMRDPSTGRLLRTRFSCSGFVQEAYRSIQVTLVDVDKLPTVTRLDLESIWGANVRVAERWYLPGDQSAWAILLPVHVLQSLARDNPRASAHCPVDRQLPPV